MILYSQRIYRFIQLIKREISSILSKEIGLKVRRERFLDRSGKVSYPIKVVIFNHKPLLGYFDSEFYELGFHERMMFASQEELSNLIRHELAHYLVTIQHGRDISPHGEEFHALCKRHGWGEAVSKAKGCLPEENFLTPPKEADVLRKVKKLLALSTSKNPFESEAALLKSRELLMQANLSPDDLDDERMILKRLLEKPRIDAKMEAIGKILETFFVSVVFRRKESGVVLEVIGNEPSVLCAEYVAAVLDHELEFHYAEAKKNSGLFGAAEKNSFFRGIAKGYCSKMGALEKVQSETETRALVLLDEKIQKAKKMAYGRLGKRTSGRIYSGRASYLGEQCGKKLEIKSGLAGTFLKCLGITWAKSG